MSLYTSVSVCIPSFSFNSLLFVVADGPDEPILAASPAQPFYVSGDNLSISCHAEGVPQPTAEWLFGGRTLSDSHKGVLNLTRVQTSQGGDYTCKLLNEETKEQRQKNITINIYGVGKKH